MACDVCQQLSVQVGELKDIIIQLSDRFDRQEAYIQKISLQLETLTLSESKKAVETKPDRKLSSASSEVSNGISGATESADVTAAPASKQFRSRKQTAPQKSVTSDIKNKSALNSKTTGNIHGSTSLPDTTTQSDDDKCCVEENSAYELEKRDMHSDDYSSESPEAQAQNGCSGDEDVDDASRGEFSPLAIDEEYGDFSTTAANEEEDEEGSAASNIVAAHQTVASFLRNSLGGNGLPNAFIPTAGGLSGILPTQPDGTNCAVTPEELAKGAAFSAFGAISSAFLNNNCFSPFGDKQVKVPKFESPLLDDGIEKVEEFYQQGYYPPRKKAIPKRLQAENQEQSDTFSANNLCIKKESMTFSTDDVESKGDLSLMHGSLDKSGLSRKSERGGEKGSFSCDICSAKFMWRGTWKRHMATVHSKIRYKCTKCGFTSSRKDYLYVHIRTNACMKRKSHPGPTGASPEALAPSKESGGVSNGAMPTFGASFSQSAKAEMENLLAAGSVAFSTPVPSGGLS